MEWNWNTRVILLLCFAAAALGQTFRELVPTHPTPRGLISDPENGCVYIIFRREIKLYCENIAGQGPSLRTVVSQGDVANNLIVDWVSRIDANGNLIFFTTKKNAFTACSAWATRASRDPLGPKVFPVFSSLNVICGVTASGTQSNNVWNYFFLSPSDNSSLFLFGYFNGTPYRGLMKINVRGSSESEMAIEQRYSASYQNRKPMFTYIAPYLACGFFGGDILVHNIDTNATLRVPTPLDSSIVNPNSLQGPTYPCAGNGTFIWGATLTSNVSTFHSIFGYNPETQETTTITSLPLVTTT
eukprot:TRINITY_DN2865_c0_g2_i1.p1 TRINITY_DN2865_c0_g2~~TRINITY_DN2865_c0_g2_i1.p1  ORF type:complete len:300 (+),score=7.57 TRINITY_DN2865_c0_g2_i1:185-1084(+)